MRILLTITLSISSCTASKVNLELLGAEQSLLRAERYGAPDRATYEYTMALRYLEKAREEAGYSEFRIADALARKSAEWSDRAIIFVERGGKGDPLDLGALPEEVPRPEPVSTDPPGRSLLEEDLDEAERE
ncbi:MAG TPA: hypothetical protein ENK18_25575 [Deltaproteobacteria bacterium]|nr:hypothetical protein [Deltaproteobacteria bacterium]